MQIKCNNTKSFQQENLSAKSKKNRNMLLLFLNFFGNNFNNICFNIAFKPYYLNEDIVN